MSSSIGRQAQAESGGYRRADTSWMRGNFGISVHWTSQSVRLDGTRLPYEAAVNAFDPETFAESLAAVGARHCIFTLTHAEEYLALPHPLLEKLLPGRTTRRDLIGELIAALDRRGIRFIAYYNHSCNQHGDAAWEKACGYADGIHGNLDRFAENICGIVEFIAKRYGTGLAGWWFDSSYSVDPRGPSNTVSCDMGDWQFPWRRLCDAAKAGYRDCAVTFNSGLGRSFLYTEYQDYYAGECGKLDQVFVPEVRADLCDHRWICADSPKWVFSAGVQPEGFVPLRFPAADLRAFRDRHLAEGRMVTFNILIDQSGQLNPVMKQLA